MTRERDKTPRAFALRMYMQAERRVTGKAANSEKYVGLPIEDKDVLVEWILAQPDYCAMLEEYEAEGYPRNLAPSLDRLDASKGYTLDNLEVVTQGENTIRANKGRAKPRYRMCPITFVRVEIKDE